MDFLSNVASEKFSSLPVCEERGGLNPSLRAKLTRVRAMYRTAATLCGGRRKACLLARAVHAQLLRHFNLTAQQLPLLELNISEIVARGFVSPLASHWSSSTLRSPLLTLQSSLPPRPLDQRLNPLKKTTCYRDVGQDDSSRVILYFVI